MTGSDKKRKKKEWCVTIYFRSDRVQSRGKTRKKWPKNKRLSGFFIQQRTGIRPNRCFEQMLQSTNLSFFLLCRTYLFFTLFFFLNIFCVIRRRHLLNSDFWGRRKTTTQLSLNFTQRIFHQYDRTMSMIVLRITYLVHFSVESVYFLFTVQFINDVDKFVYAI